MSRDQQIIIALTTKKEKYSSNSESILAIPESQLFI